jgi:cysteine-S-conjugate beta-lyase
MDREEYLRVLDRALEGMRSIARELAPDLNRSAPVPGANTAFGLVTHCLGVCGYWLGALVAGREVVRDREAEFRASGTLAELEAALADGRSRIRADLAHYRPGAPLAARPDRAFLGPDETGMTQDGVLLHVLEELAQHHGQLEVLRDVLRSQAPTASAAADGGAR